jgi:protein-disulfide isomerase
MYVAKCSTLHVCYQPHNYLSTVTATKDVLLCDNILFTPGEALGILNTMRRLPFIGSPACLAMLILSLAACTTLAPGPLNAQGILLPSYGQGKINVRVYTDYFCVPCRAGEPKIEALLTDLVKGNKINLTFVDTPAHQETPLYARYFLYILNYKKDFEHAIFARNVLFDAASIKIITKEKLEEFLAHKGVRYKPFDAKQTFNAMSKHIKEDEVKSTPTVVIDNGSQKQPFTGVDNIIRALELLK